MEIAYIRALLLMLIVIEDSRRVTSCIHVRRTFSFICGAYYTHVSNSLAPDQLDCLPNFTRRTGITLILIESIIIGIRNWVKLSKLT